jgi:hypothetical protein
MVSRSSHRREDHWPKSRGLASERRPLHRSRTGIWTSAVLSLDRKRLLVGAEISADSTPDQRSASSARAGTILSAEKRSYLRGTGGTGGARRGNPEKGWYWGRYGVGLGPHRQPASTTLSRLGTAFSQAFARMASVNEVDFWGGIGAAIGQAACGRKVMVSSISAGARPAMPSICM